MYRIIETEEREDETGEWIYSFHITDEHGTDISIKQVPFLTQLTPDELEGVQSGVLKNHERAREQLSLSSKKDEVVLVQSVEELLRKKGILKHNETLQDLEKK